MSTTAPTNTQIVRARMTIESARRITDRLEVPSHLLVLEAAEVLAAALDDRADWTPPHGINRPVKRWWKP